MTPTPEEIRRWLALRRGGWERVKVEPHPRFYAYWVALDEHRWLLPGTIAQRAASFAPWEGAVVRVLKNWMEDLPRPP